MKLPIHMSERDLYFPERFQAASRYYSTGRPTYPRLLSQRVANLVGLERNGDVLDIGTGTGFLAIDFAPYAKAVTALDPSAEMLQQAAENARRAGAEIKWVHGSSYDLGAHFGRFRLATFGRSFHWTDRPATLLVLDDLIEQGGAVALFSDRFPDVPQNAWYAPYSAILEQHAGEVSARRERRSSPTHEAILLDSPFDQLERIAVLERRLTPIEYFVDCALSFSKAWNAGVVSRLDELTAEIRAVLAGYVREDGTVEEVVEGLVLIARRSRDQQPGS
jgi:SAM-dependent methyltransferase